MILGVKNRSLLPKRPNGRQNLDGSPREDQLRISSRQISYDLVGLGWRHWTSCPKLDLYGITKVVNVRPETSTFVSHPDGSIVIDYYLDRRVFENLTKLSMCQLEQLAVESFQTPIPCSIRNVGPVFKA